METLAVTSDAVKHLILRMTKMQAVLGDKGKNSSAKLVHKDGELEHRGH